LSQNAIFARIRAGSGFIPAIQRKIFTKTGYFLDQTEIWGIIMVETETISLDITDTRLNISSGGDVFFINNLITSNVLNALSKTGNSAEHNSMGFTVYLWHVWNDYIRKSVGAG